MRYVNQNFETIKETDVDLSKGRLEIATGIREDATPIDNTTKFAWFDDDYEEVQMYVLNKEIEYSELPQSNELAQIIDALLGFGGNENE